MRRDLVDEELIQLFECFDTLAERGVVKLDGIGAL